MVPRAEAASIAAAVAAARRILRNLRVPSTHSQVVLVLLRPLSFVAYGCATFGFGPKLMVYLRYRFTHSNPSVPCFFRSKVSI